MLRSALIGTVLSTGLLAGCSAEALPPVFGAVFGLEGADVAPFRVGTLPEPVVKPGDAVIGLAAAQPGQCIYRRASTNYRFRAECPEAYALDR